MLLITWQKCLVQRGENEEVSILLSFCLMGDDPSVVQQSQNIHTGHSLCASGTRKQACPGVGGGVSQSPGYQRSPTDVQCTWLILQCTDHVCSAYSMVLSSSKCKLCYWLISPSSHTSPRSVPGRRPQESAPLSVALFSQSHHHGFTGGGHGLSSAVCQANGLWKILCTSGLKGIWL